MNERLVALNILSDIFTQGRSLTQVLPKVESHEHSALIKQYAFGVCRWYFQSRAFLQQLLNKPLKEKDQDIELLLILGIYELSHMSTQQHAVVNECVKLTEAINKSWASGLVNAVLRNFIRKKETLIDNSTAHPKWLIKQLKRAWPEQWESIIEANNTHPPMTIRVNRQLLGADEYLARHPIGQRINAIPEAIMLDTPMPVQQLPGFDSGLVSVQDQSAQLAAHLLDLKPGLRVLDACAAPGGKTCHILELEPKLELLSAIDIDPDRVQLIKNNLARLNLTAKVMCADANESSWWDGKPFDRILIDAPCSATGVIRRHPDIKYHRHLSDIAQLNTQQINLLNALWPRLKPGGLLVYATCSVLPQENHVMIARFLAKNKDAVDNNIELELGFAQPHGVQLLPKIDGGDGFYYAVLKKSIP